MVGDLKQRAIVPYRAWALPQYQRWDAESLKQFPPKIENLVISGEFFVAGPVTSRVAILDLDPETGELVPGVPFKPAGRGKVRGHYDLPEDVSSREFNQVHVFATVWKTIRMFEEGDSLGREVPWAFNAPQLLVVPRAGQMENAFYERDSHSLQFFYFPSHVDPSLTVFNSLIRDIIAHETGHAIFDGIATHLWDAPTPESLALHEAVGDLCGLLVSLDTHSERRRAFLETGGSILDSTIFSALGEEFGMARGTGALRNLRNDYTMNDLAGSDPHELSQVLTGALYQLLIALYEEQGQQEIARTGKGLFMASGRALAIAAARFRRLILRALDYLPPGEVSFADYGRAIVATLQALGPDGGKERDWLCDEFVRRGMVPDRGALEVRPPVDGLRGINLQQLMTSRSAAYYFVHSEHGRRLLGIPPGVLAEVDPPVLAEKRFYERTGDGGFEQTTLRECLLKVWWHQAETNGLGPGYPPRRQVTVGTTLVWDLDTGQIRSLLSSDHSGRPQEQVGQQAGRDQMLRDLAYRGLLRPQHLTLGPDGRPLRMAQSFDAADDIMRVRSVARVLCFAGEA